MKKLLCAIAVVALCVPAAAQQYIIVDDELPILASDVDQITYEQDSQFEAHLLPGLLAADPKTKLFSDALQLTGLDETLSNYIYADYQAPSRYYYYKAHIRNEVAIYNAQRFKNFTMFVETDDALAAHGITTLDQLKAYAKQVYDEAFPEDASVTDPKDRRNSLNRFVSYHILPHGSTYWFLTFYDGKMTEKFVDTDMTDINTWYATLMPHASLKCSYPMGNERGIFLNRSGLKDGPDKYGKQVRGAKVLPANTDPDDPFTQQAFNGYYYYIDDILTYDTSTQEQLGGELWRVDFKTLSPDIMNNAVELRGNYLVDDGIGVADLSGKNGRNYTYKWDCMENITGEDIRVQLVARRAHAEFWCWQGDEVDLFGNGGSVNIKLPPLPAGEWEIRMGTNALETRPSMRVYLNGQVTIDSLGMTHNYYGAEIPFNEISIKNEILDYMVQHFFQVTPQNDGWFLVTDLTTGEQILLPQDPFNLYESTVASERRYRGFLASERDIYSFVGTDPATGEYLNWNDRASNYREQAKNDVLAMLPKVMKGPRECLYFTSSGNAQSFYDDYSGTIVRYPLGRIQTDGKSDNYLKLEYLPVGPGSNNELMLDYFEFVPKSLWDQE
jgi:hypothetical protein